MSKWIVIVVDIEVNRIVNVNLGGIRGLNVMIKVVVCICVVSQIVSIDIVVGGGKGNIEVAIICCVVVGDKRNNMVAEIIICVVVIVLVGEVIMVKVRCATIVDVVVVHDCLVSKGCQYAVVA
jgi:hypothetical protein